MSAITFKITDDEYQREILSADQENDAYSRTMALNRDESTDDSSEGTNTPGPHSIIPGFA